MLSFIAVISLLFFIREAFLMIDVLIVCNAVIIVSLVGYTIFIDELIETWESITIFFEKLVEGPDYRDVNALTEPIFITFIYLIIIYITVYLHLFVFSKHV